MVDLPIKNKNNRNDAERLAKLLYLGETPTVHVPSPEVRTWRELINCRSQVIAKRTRAKNAVRALLRSAGIVPPRQPGLWTKKGLAWLRQLALPTASQQLRRDLLLEEIETLIHQVRRIEQQLNHQAQHSPAVTCLRSIPGVGIRTADAVAAFVDDPHRFPHAKAIGRYFGLVPTQDQSADRNRLGHITREGAPVVRRLVAEASWQAYADRRRSARSSSTSNEVTRDEEDRAGGHGPLSGAGDVGHAEARNRLGGESGPGRVAEHGSTRRMCYIITYYAKRAHVEIESGTEVASRGPPWRDATPLV